MIALDTNVLLRLWLQDDQKQFEQASKMLAAYAGQVAAILLCDVVLAESVWALRSVYRSTTDEIAFAIEATLAQPAYAFENRDAVESALKQFRSGSADFSDCLIAAKCKSIGAEFTATFDRKMKSLPGVKVIGSQQLSR